MFQDHRRLVDVTLARDPEGAQQELREHLLLVLHLLNQWDFWSSPMVTGDRTPQLRNF